MRVDSAPYFREIVKNELSGGRFEHCRRTEETCLTLLDFFGFSRSGKECNSEIRQCVRLAGLLHDIARELPVGRMLENAAKYGELTEWERHSPLLAHGKAGAWVLGERFGIRNRDTLEAVRTHTVAEPGMSDCGKIVYIADFIEPGRKHIEPDFLAKYAGLSLDDMLSLVVTRTLRHLTERGRYIAGPSLRLYLELKGEVFKP